MTARTTGRALSGTRLVELAGIGPVQLGCMILADHGAEVVRVDRPSAVPESAPSGPSADVLDRGRRSIALDLKSEDGLEAFRRLLAGADVLVDPYRPGVLERLGLDPQELLADDPRLIVARMTGWGQDGPLARAAAHDLNYIAAAGALHSIGTADELPQVPLNVVADFGGGGMLLAVGVLAALLERAGSGLGQVLDVAMVDGTALQLAGVLQVRAQGGWIDERGANWLQGAAPWYRPYWTGDRGIVTVAALEPPFYALLLESVGLEPDAWPQWDQSRWQELAHRLERIFARDSLAAWRDRLEGTDACFAAAVPLHEAHLHPQMAARETYVERHGAIQPAPAPRLSRTPGRIDLPPPWPGEHTVELLAELGFDADERERLRGAGATRALPIKSD